MSYFKVLRSLIQKYNPAVRKEYLLIPAGSMWMGVGIMLCSMAFVWLLKASHPYTFASMGIVAGVIIYRFGFLRLAKKNIDRISVLEGRRCFFSFITFRSYILVIFMIALGITLRHSRIHKDWLSLIYNGIGLGLAISSISYFKAYCRLQRLPQITNPADAGEGITPPTSS
jgi:hypothetical protein